jgi:hypothetical protein
MKTFQYDVLLSHNSAHKMNRMDRRKTAQTGVQAFILQPFLDAPGRRGKPDFSFRLSS